MFLRGVACAAAICALSARAFAQASSDPMDEFYFLARSWRNRGVVSELPPMRPYPLANIKAILEEAMENGTARDAADAGAVWETVTGRKLYGSLSADVSLKHSADDDGSETGKFFGIYPAVRGDISFTESDFVSMGYNIGLAIRSDSDVKFLPSGVNSAHDAVQDSVDLGGADMYLDMNNALAAGRRDVFLQAGIFRSGYSGFLGEELSINSTAYHSSNLSFTYMGGRFKYAQQISMIGATRSFDSDIKSLTAGKWRAFHSAGYDFLDWLSVAYYETVVFGGRFDASYLFPVPYMVAQGIGGCDDGLFMGLLIDVRPAEGLLWTTDILVDDFDVEQALKLNLDAKYRVAFKTGLEYTPGDSVVSLLSAGYTLVTPYTYSHWQYDDGRTASITPDTINFQNYTNNGICMGSRLQPNSDMIGIRAELRPLPALRLGISTAFMRHGNVCESLSDEEAAVYLKAQKGVYATDGSISTHSMFADEESSSGRHVETAWEKLNFLSQRHIQYTVQGGLDALYDFPASRRGSRVSLRAGLVFEYIRNFGVDRPMFEGLSLDESATEIKLADGSEISMSDEGWKSRAADSWRDAWASSLRDVVNFYASAGFSIRF